MTANLVLLIVAVAVTALWIGPKLADRRPANRRNRTRTNTRNRARNNRANTPRANTRRVHTGRQRPTPTTPGPFAGTVTVTRRSTCARCHGPILRGEYARPTRNGLVGPCCR